MPRKLQIFYDGGCPVCAREICFYRKRPGTDAFEWVDVRQPNLGRLGAVLSRELALKRMHVRLADGELLSGAAAFGATWQRLPGFVWLGKLVALPVIDRCTELVYRVFLVIRPLWRRTPRR